MSDSGYFGTGYALTSDPNNNSIYWSGGDYYTGSAYIMSASKSTNGGTSWTRYNLGSGTGDTYVTRVDPTSSNIVYAGGVESSAPAIYKTINGGTSWNKLASTGLSGTVYDIAIDPTNTNILYAATSSGIYRSTNGGTNWSSTGMSGGRANAVLLDPDDHTDVYAGTYSNGVYYSSNSGSTWTQMNTGLGELNVNRLGINPGVYLFAGSNGKSMYRWSLQVGVDEEYEHNVAQPILYAFPNPASRNSTFAYTITQEGHAELSVFDIQGRLVKTLVNGIQNPGKHTIAWDGMDNSNNHVAAGVYFCKLSTAEQVAIEKLVLMW